MFRKSIKDEYMLQDTLSITMELQLPTFDEEEIKDEIQKPKVSKGKILILSLIAIISFIFIYGVIWINDSYEGLELSTKALISNDEVEVNISNNRIVFNPIQEDVTKALILLQGAKVDAKAYSPLARELANRGYKVILLNNDLNLPLVNEEIISSIISNNPKINDWVIGGHSLGGVVASSLINKNSNLDGLLLLASYPSGNELKYTDRDVMSIWGSKDGVLNFERFAKAKEDLPKSTQFVEIEGANHSQFGDYGLQNGDNEALITSEEQLQITVDSIIELFDSIKS